MKPTTKTLFAALLLLALSCKKENTAIQLSGSTDESTTQALLSDMNEPAAKEVTIGTQVWMKRNWTGGRYRNGDRIPQVTDPGKWAALTTGAWCWYNNDSANGHIYGKLYNWYAVNDPRGLAPEGWHIPSDAEWTTLTTYLGGEAVAGGKMKSRGTIEAGTGLWFGPIPMPPTAAASQGFRAAPVATVGRSTPLATTVYGGVLLRTVQAMPGPASCITTMAPSTGTTAISLMAFLFAA